MNNCAFSNYLTSVLRRGLVCEVYLVLKNMFDKSFSMVSHLGGLDSHVMKACSDENTN